MAGPHAADHNSEAGSSASFQPTFLFISLAHTSSAVYENVMEDSVKDLLKACIWIYPKRPMWTLQKVIAISYLKENNFRIDNS